MDRQRLAFCVIEHGAPPAVNLRKFRMQAPAAVAPAAHFPGIARIIAYHGKCAVIVVRDDDPPELAFFGCFVRIHFQYFHIIMVQVNRIIIFAGEGNGYKSVFIVPVGKNRIDAEDLPRFPAHAFRKGFTHRKDHFHISVPEIAVPALSVRDEGRKGARIHNQYLYAFAADAVKDPAHMFIAHVGNVDHQQVILYRPEAGNGILPFDPRTELPPLHPEAEAVQLHDRHEIHIDMVHLVGIRGNRKRRSGRAARGEHRKLILAPVKLAAQDPVVMADEVALGLNGKIIQAVAEFKILIERTVAVGILQDRAHAAPPVLLRHTVDELEFCHFLELLLFPSVHIVQ